MAREAENIYHDNIDLNNLIGDNNDPDEKELLPIGTLQAALFANQCEVTHSLNIGHTTLPFPTQMPRTLQTDEQKVLHQMFGIMGVNQATERSLQLAPSWILEKAVNLDLQRNLKDLYLAVNETTIPPYSNVIGSRFVYKIMTDKNDKKQFKARLCLHGHRDKLKNFIQKNASSAQFDVICLLQSVAAILSFELR